MNCSRCGKSPAQLYKKRGNGGEEQFYLCDGCYKALYGAPDEAEFFTSRLNTLQHGQEKKCPVCNTSLEDFRRTGLLGCAQCYRTFAETLAPTIRQIHGKLSHEGKTPSAHSGENYPLIRELVQEQERLKEEMERALREGDYRAAERIKEKLIAIHHKLYEGENK